jgi:hypothetical protein
MRFKDASFNRVGILDREGPNLVVEKVNAWHLRNLRDGEA